MRLVVRVGEGRSAGRVRRRCGRRLPARPGLQRAEQRLRRRRQVRHGRDCFAAPAGTEVADGCLQLIERVLDGLDLRSQLRACRLAQPGQRLLHIIDRRRDSIRPTSDQIDLLQRINGSAQRLPIGTDVTRRWRGASAGRRTATLRRRHFPCRLSRWRPSMLPAAVEAVDDESSSPHDITRNPIARQETTFGRFETNDRDASSHGSHRRLGPLRPEGGEPRRPVVM